MLRNSEAEIEFSVRRSSNLRLYVERLPDLNILHWYQSIRVACSHGAPVLTIMCKCSGALGREEVLSI